MVYVFLATGFEETEALLPVDILLRGGVLVKTVGVGDKKITGAHGISVNCDVEISDTTFKDLDAIVLPGGMPGTVNLEKDKTVQDFIDYAYKQEKYICAICAAPSILGHKGILAGKKAICYPGMEKHLKGAIVTDDLVVTDGKIITAKGPGAAADFGFAILQKLAGDKVKDKVYNDMCFKRK